MIERIGDNDWYYIDNGHDHDDHDNDHDDFMVMVVLLLFSYFSNDKL